MSNFTENNSIDKENFKSFMSTILSLARMYGIWIDDVLATEAAEMLVIDEENAVPIEHAETDTVTESNGISET